MHTDTIREKLYDYIRFVNDKKVKAAAVPGMTFESSSLSNTGGSCSKGLNQTERNYFC